MRGPTKTSCDEQAIYALSRKNDRNIKSMTAFLFGLCSTKDSLPTPFPEPTDVPSNGSSGTFDNAVIPKPKKDFIMNVTYETCQRFYDIKE